MPYPGIELFREYGPNTANRGSATETAGEFGEPDVKTGGWLGALGGAAFLAGKFAPRVAKPLLTWGAGLIHKVMGKVGYVRTAPAWVPALTGLTKRVGGAIYKDIGLKGVVTTARTHGVGPTRMAPAMIHMGGQVAGAATIIGGAATTVAAMAGAFSKSAAEESQPEISYTAEEAKEKLYKGILPEAAQWYTVLRDLFVTYYFGRKAFMTVPMKTAVNIKFDVDFAKKLRTSKTKGQSNPRTYA